MRIALGVALLIVLGTLAIELSGQASRIASTNHVNPLEFSAAMPAGGTLCQPGVQLASDAASFKILIGTYGRPVPAAASTFTDAQGRLIASGHIPAGRAQGYVTLPLSYPHGPSTGGTLCIRFAGHEKLVIGGEPAYASPATEQINGQPAAGVIDIVFLRPGRESWWELLPTLAYRFGLGKSSLFGDWTLPCATLLLAAAWLLALRLLTRESA